MPQWLIELLNESLKPAIDSIWGSLLFWRTLALILLMPIIAVVLKREWLTSLLLSPERREHDRSLFTRADQLLPESGLYNALERLGADNALFQ
ncbi:MAG TPA: hypothetical protein VI729_09040 [Anaerolineales bacterium]|nr:hypothetical protein [Anaerolineales bacterium]